MARHVFHIRSEDDRPKLAAWCARAPVGWDVEFRQATRSTEQNRAMWAALDDLAEQVDWYGRRLTSDQWKDVLTASLKQQIVVPGIDGGFVAVGTSTRKMTVSEMSDLIELIRAFGAQQGVQFSEDA